MADKILHKRSGTPSAVPSAGSLVLGELALNTADGRAFMKKGDGSVVEIGANGSAFFSLVTVTATSAGQTSFTIPGGYTPGAVVVFLDGASLAPAHYTATNGTTVVLISGTGVVVGSELVVLRLSAFQVADALPLLGTAADSSKLGGIDASSYQIRSQLGSFAYADYAAAPFVNLMPDSGRFGGKINPLALTFTASFTASGFFSAYNSGAWSSGGKFIHNNTTYGGTAGALAADVQELLLAMGREEQGSDGNSLRYGVEFHVGKYTAGSGTSASGVGADGTTRYLATTNGNRAIFGASGQCTFVAWVKVLSGSVHIAQENQQPSLFLNGIAVQPASQLAAADGWAHVRLNLKSRPGYQTGFPFIYATTGAVFLIACPAFFNGIVDTGLHPSPILNINELIA